MNEIHSTQVARRPSAFRPPRINRAAQCLRRAAVAGMFLLPACYVPRSAGEKPPEADRLPRFEHGNFLKQIVPDKTVINSFEGWSNAIDYLNLKFGESGLFTQILWGAATSPIFGLELVTNALGDVGELFTTWGPTEPTLFRKQPVREEEKH